MPKLRTKTILAPEVDFLAIPDHYVNLTAKIAYATLTSLKDSKAAAVYGVANVIPRGTLVHVDEDGVVTVPTYVKTSKEDGTKPNAVIFDTIYIDDYTSGTDDFINATVLVHGFVRKDRIKEVRSGDKALLDNGMIYVLSK